MNRLLLFAACWAITGPSLAETRPELSLAGPWQLRLDPETAGVEAEYWRLDFESKVPLPGSITAHGFGDDVGPATPWVGTDDAKAKAAPRFNAYLSEENFKFPFWLQPEKYYRGAAWYQRQLNIPEAWKNKRVVLHLERPHWETSVWLDGRLAGAQDSLSTPHQYDLGMIDPGTHRLTLRVDNSCQRINVGPNSHSVSDHTQGNWNGVVGQIKLIATDLVWIDDIRVEPDLNGKCAKVTIALGNRSGSRATGAVTLSASPTIGEPSPLLEVPYEFDGTTHRQTILLPLGEQVQLWDEFNPALYQLQVALKDSAGHADSLKTRFGMRQMGTKGSQFTINGRPLFLRGTLECAVFPKTGHPPTTVAEWQRIIGVCKDYGLNHIRFHSWCPPEAAFVAADELGFYLQVECGSWAMFGSSVGDGRSLDQWLYKEGQRITRAYGNHPSFVLMAYGNEPSGKHHKEWLAEWCRYWRQAEPRMLHAPASGWPLLEESDYHITYEGVRIQEWGEGLNSIINAKAPQTRFDFSEFLGKHSDKPTISHEIGQWCVFPDFTEIPKYDGLLKPKNFEVFHDFLKQAGMADQAHDFLMASGKLQALCYKHDIEASLRTRGFGGFQLLGLSDFPGQGTALVGILDPFWESKGYVTAPQHRRYCSATVPLARMDRMVWTAGETLEADIEVAHFGAHDLQQTATRWSLTRPDGKSVGSGVFEKRNLITGGNTDVGRIRVPLQSIKQATKLVLEVSVNGTDAINHWELWCYPEQLASPDHVAFHFTRELDGVAIRKLEQGGKVLWMIPPDRVKTDVALGFSSIFWNTAWTGQQAPHTLGILCDPRHPALAEFPTDFHSSWQWWDLLSRAATLEMDSLPAELRPIVQVVPDWFAPKRLGLAFEAKVGRGSLLVTSMDLETDLERRPVARQMRRSLKSHISGKNFNPACQLDIHELRTLVKDSR